MSLLWALLCISAIAPAKLFLWLASEALAEEQTEDETLTNCPGVVLRYGGQRDDKLRELIRMVKS